MPVTKNAVQFTDYIRLLAYSGARRNEALALRWNDVDFEQAGNVFSYGVEVADCELNGTALRVLNRSLFATEDEANAKFRTAQVEMTKPPKAPVGTREGQEETRAILGLQALANKTLDPVAKKRHLEKVEDIRKVQRDRAVPLEEAAAKKARSEQKQRAAMVKLINEYFPTVAKATTVYAFPQNDEPGRKWLADIAKAAQCRTHAVETPEAHKDPNVWTRAGADSRTVFGAIAEARVVPTEERLGEDDDASRLAEQIATRRFDIHNQPPTQPARYHIGGVPVCTTGNLSAITAGIKSDKSSWIAAMIAAVMTSRPAMVDCLGITSSNPEGLALIHIDTEQNIADHWQLVHRSVPSRSKSWRVPGIVGMRRWKSRSCCLCLWGASTWRFGPKPKSISTTTWWWKTTSTGFLIPWSTSRWMSG